MCVTPPERCKKYFNIELQYVLQHSSSCKNGVFLNVFFQKSERTRASSRSNKFV